MYSWIELDSESERLNFNDINLNTVPSFRNTVPSTGKRFPSPFSEKYPSGENGIASQTDFEHSNRANAIQLLGRLEEAFDAGSSQRLRHRSYAHRVQMRT
jgi:hypothetical protein